jgi:hypothetical protein
VILWRRRIIKEFGGILWHLMNCNFGVGVERSFWERICCVTLERGK